MCPVDETGRNSVIPSTIAMMIDCIKLIAFTIYGMLITNSLQKYSHFPLLKTFTENIFENSIT
jgi:hypothetical protein